MPKEIFILRNRVTLQAAILDCSEAAVQGHQFFFLCKYYYTTTSKPKITTTRVQKIRAAPGNNKKKCKRKRMNE